MQHKSIAKSAGIIGFATLVSRVLGFVRDITIAWLFGTAIYAQAFVVAFRIPNLLRDVVGEGATNAAVIPVLSQYKVNHTKEEFWKTVGNLFNVIFVILAVISVLGVLFSPFIVRAIAPGFIAEPDKLEATIKLTRIMFPYILLIGLTAFFMGLLNSCKHFAVPAFGPAVLNICIIVSAWFFSSKLEEQALSLAIGVMAGGVMQLLMNVPVLMKKGFVFSKKLDFKDEVAKKTKNLLIPRVMGSCIYQMNIFVDTIVASLSGIVGAGGVAALYYSNRLVQFPMAIFGSSVAQAALPAMSDHAATNDIDKLKKTLSFSLRAVLFIAIPSSIGLMILAKPIVTILFQRGKFDAYSADITSAALVFYSIGLFAYAGVKVLVSCFYSMHDTMTPVKTAGACLFVNIVLNLALMFPLKIGGLALATSISAILNFVILTKLLSKKLDGIGAREIRTTVIKVVIASAIMGIVCWFFSKNLTSSVKNYSAAIKIIRLFIPILLSVIVYIASCFALKVKEMRTALEWISRKK